MSWTLPKVTLAHAALIFAAMAAWGCGGGLSRGEALRIIRTSKALRPTDTVSVGEISPSALNESSNESPNQAPPQAPNEVLVRATILEETTNLKFRKFDAGWSWESVQAESGDWISVDQAVAQIRTRHRAAAASEWAGQHKGTYAATAAAMNILLQYTPTPKIGINADEWMKERVRSAGFIEKSHMFPDWQERAALLRNTHAADAWGNELLVICDSQNNTLTLVSIGPDKTKNTDDDLIGVTKWRPVVEDWWAGNVLNQVRWRHENSWKLPEGLGDVVEKFAEKPWSTIEYSSVVKP